MSRHLAAAGWAKPPVRPNHVREETPLVASLRDGLAFGAVVATFVAVLGLFAISPITLEAGGIAYLSPGGGLFAKFHPSTFVAVAALAMRCLATRHPLRTAWRLMTGDSGIVLLMAAVTVAIVFAVFIDKTPVTPLGDTFVLPIIVFLLLRDLDPTVARYLTFLLIAILVLNAGIAIAEFLRGWRLVTITVPESATADPTHTNETFSWQAELAIDWRASALLGHPLVNGMITSVFILCLIASKANWLSWTLRASLITLAAASMFSFGARGALVLSLFFGVWLLAFKIPRAIDRGARIAPRELAISLLVAGTILVGIVLLADSGFLDRTIQRFSQDGGSATTRLTMFSLIQPMSWADLMFKPDKDLVATLQRIYGLEFGIESSWVGLTLTYGLIVTGLILIGLLAFFASILRWSEPGAGSVLVLFFILTSVSASMSGKTTAFAMTVALLMLFLRKSADGSTNRRAGMV